MLNYPSSNGNHGGRGGAYDKPTPQKLTKVEGELVVFVGSGKCQCGRRVGRLIRIRGQVRQRFWQRWRALDELIHDFVQGAFGEQLGNLLVQQTPARKMRGELFVCQKTGLELREFLGIYRAVEITAEQMIEFGVISHDLGRSFLGQLPTNASIQDGSDAMQHHEHAVG